MYKLVIVDDEPSVLKGLSTYFDWLSYGIELAGMADDGDTGLELIERIKPDIVLTDVKMPALDGISMATELRSRFPAMKLVFISGHGNADYLKSALKVHAVDYIFKPISRKELRTVMGHVVEALEEERQQRRMINDMQVKLAQSMPLLREKFLMSLIHDRLSPGSIGEKIRFLGVPIPADSPCIVLCITVDDAAQVMEHRTERDRQLLSYAALNVIQELMDKQFRGVVFEHKTGEFVSILALEQQEEAGGDTGFEQALVTLAESIRDNLGKWLKLSVTIGVGERTDSLSGLPSSYMRAREAVDLRWYLGKNKVLTLDHLESGESARYRFEPESGEAVLSALNSGETGRLQAELVDIFGLLGHNRRNGFRYAKNVGLQLILLSGRALLELNLLTEEWESRETDAWERTMQLETMQDLQDHVISYLSGVCRSIHEKRKGKAGSAIRRIRRLIEERYAENLTVRDIAEGVYLSATYVSLLYKQETGETLFEYLTKIRMDKAKELLKDPQNKLYEVCYAVGYSDPSHFSKLFKKLTGLTPSAYREQQL